MPQALQNKPEISFCEQFYLEIFGSISRSRPFTQAGPLPIPLETALLSYCLFYGIHDVDQRESIAKAVVALDNEYLADFAKKQADKAP